MLFAVTLAVFWPVGTLPFISYDDHIYVTENGWVQQGLSPQGAAWALRSREAANWHPVTWLSHMLDVTLWGSGPAGPHWTNLLLHACNVVLLFLLLDGLTANRWPSALAAALFGLHPLHVESVAWVSERKDVLSAFFGLLSLWSFSRYALARTRPLSRAEPGMRTEPDFAQRRPQCFYGFALICYALGLMSKPMVVTLPFVLVLLDYWPLRRVLESDFRNSLKRVLVEKLPFFILSAISCIITWRVQSGGGAMGSLASFPVWARIGNAFVSYARYLTNLAWPTQLALPYPHPGRWSPLLELFCFALILGLTLAAGAGRKRAPFAAVGWFWFLGMLVPVIGIVQVGSQAMADRYTYLPSVGIFIAVAWGVEALRNSCQRRREVTAMGALIVLMAFALRTRNQLEYWRESDKLFRHALAVAPNNYSALVNLGASLYARGQLDDALEQYQRAVQLQPDGTAALNGLGTVFASKQDNVRAANYYRAALQTKPDFSDAHGNLGVILRRQGDLEGALRELREALRLSPANAQAHNNLGNVLVHQKNIAEAVKHYRLAVTYAPQFTLALDNLGWALAQQGRYAEAVTCCKRAVEINPDNSGLRASFGDLLLRMARNEEAKAQFSIALKLSPDSPEAHLGFAKALARTGEAELAATHLRETLRLKPGDEEARTELINLGKAAAP